MTSHRALNNSLGRLLAASPLPIYVLDGQRTIVYGNAAFFAWTATDGEQLIGVRCDYHSSPEVGPASEIAAKLCPPAEAFRGQRLTAEVACRRTPDELSRRRAEFIPLGSDELELIGVMAIVEPTDLRTPGQPPAESNPSPAQLHHRLLALRERVVPRYGIDRLVGDSPTIRRIREQVRFAHQSRVRTVIFGPPGSGREHVARTIHYGNDPRTAGRLIPIACPLMDAELLQATITSVLRHPDEGSPEQSQPSLLLQDVDQLPETAQYELAGFFALPGFEVHTLVTSRAELLDLASQGKFRQDLAAALSTLNIHLPPLPERREDIPALAQVFLEQFNSTGGKQLSGFAPEALDRLVAHPWPGNVDELAEIVHEACAHAEGTLVNAWDLPQRLRHAADAAAYPRKDTEEETIALDAFLAEVEGELIRRALHRAKGNKTQAARLLGVTRARLHRRLEQLNPLPDIARASDPDSQRPE